MTSLTIHTPANSINTVLSMSASSSFDKKIKTDKGNTTYTSTSSNWYRKPAVRLASIDWDLNMNELEFE